MSEAIFLLKSGRCAWGKCLFCGYGRIQERVLSLSEFREKLDKFLDSLNPGVHAIKVFGSGSFLDDRQTPGESRRYFIEACLSKGIDKVTIESRPEFITEEKIDEFRGIDLTIAIGLEVASDPILKKIHKGLCLRDFEEAASLVHKKGAGLRTYLLVNLPYINDPEKTLDESVKYALKFSDSLVLINLLPHGHTPLFKLWLRGEWNFLGRDEFYKTVDDFRSNPKIELDAETFRFIPKFPEELRENLSGVGERYLTHPHYEVWQDYLVRWYRPPEKRKLLLFLPCSYKKPYSESETHKLIRGELRKIRNSNMIHEVMLSNAGVVPREFEDYYPFNSYDWDEKKETDEVRRRYVEVTEGRITKYLQAHRGGYSAVFCFLKYKSESFNALKTACEKLGIGLNNLLTRDINESKPLQTEEALRGLYTGLVSGLEDASDLIK